MGYSSAMHAPDSKSKQIQICMGIMMKAITLWVCRRLEATEYSYTNVGGVIVSIYIYLLLLNHRQCGVVLSNESHHFSVGNMPFFPTFP
jgi:hypothetical protein